tara:strand:- start:877 stop:1668 length:792 start_codon:yes stop_codon:yes gene_type:complete
MNLILKKSLGQNFLVDKNLIKFITEIGNINHDISVLEVGPGNGSLTSNILEKGPKDLTVIEKDKRLVDILFKKFGNKINIVNEDMMNISYDNFIQKNLVIFGNLPYNISTQILVKWIKTNSIQKLCNKLILMFQKEVADRIIAEPNTKHYGRLSILSNWKMKIDKVIDIEPKSFNPAPKVRSTLLTFIPKKKFFEINEAKNLEYITNVFFNQKRKMIKKPMRFLFKNFEEVSKNLSIDLKLRPQNLDYLTYYKICKHYEALIK